MFDTYKNRMRMRGNNISEMLRMQSNMVIEHTWERDPNARRVYVVQVNNGMPEVTVEHELIDVKFNIDTYSKITSDEPAYLLQFRHGEEKRHPEIAIGSYVYMQDEDGEWKWWMIVYLDERPSFRQYMILECNWELSWVVDNKIYRCLTVQRVQQSYNSGSWAGDRTTKVDNITAVWLPTNNDTLTIGYNQRFLISDPRRLPPLAWSTSKIEDTQPVGLTKLKLTQSTFDPTHDSAELMLADYYRDAIEPEKADAESEHKGIAEITYNGAAPTVRVGGSFKVFTPVFSGAGVTVERWTISDGNDDIAVDTQNYTIKYDDDKLKLKVSQNYYLIDKVLTVRVYGSDGSTAELKVQVIG